MNWHYLSAFGDFEVPADVMARASRLEHKYGRHQYLEDWCRWQYIKASR
jgi:HEPN domain-containing protein